MVDRLLGMSRIWSSLLLLATFSSIAAAPGAHTVRVLTYNIHHGEGMDGFFDLPRLARIIEATGADLVALQEVDQGTQRSSGVNELTELARLTRFHPAFGKAMDFQGGGYGMPEPLWTDAVTQPGTPRALTTLSTHGTEHPARGTVMAL